LPPEPGGNGANIVSLVATLRLHYYGNREVAMGAADRSLAGHLRNKEGRPR